MLLYSFFSQVTQQTFYENAFILSVFYNLYTLIFSSQTVECIHMSDKLKKYICNKTTLTCYAVSLAAGILYGALRGPFLLHFIDGLTIAGFLILAIGLCRWAYIQGDFTFFSWHPNKRVRKRAPGEKFYGTDNSNPSENMGYREYRHYVRNQRKDMDNMYMPAGILIIVVSIILSVLYSIH